MNQLPAQSSSSQATLQRRLGTPDGVAVLVGITIGVGIYSTPQIIARYLDSFSLIILLWVLVGIFAFIGSLIYAELGTRLPRTGGEYAYIHHCFGRQAGFLFGWSQLLIIRTSPAAALSLVAADYLGYFLPLGGSRRTWTALGIIAVLGLFNYLGVGPASAFQKISTLAKIVGVFFFSGLGILILWITPDLSRLPMSGEPTVEAGPLAAFAAAMMLIVFSHTGFDRVGYVAGEMRNPSKVIPASMFIGMSLVIVAYLSLNVIYHYTLGIEGVRESELVASDAAVKLVGSTGAGFVALLVIISAVSSTNGTMMAASRVYYAMARDGIFFQWLNYVHPIFRTPSRAVLAHCFWGAVILLVRQRFETIVSGMAFAVLIFYGLATLGLFRLRKQDVGSRDSFRVPGYPLIPGLYLAGIVGLVALRFFFEFDKSVVDLAYILSGVPFAWFWCRRRKSSPP